MTPKMEEFIARFRPETPCLLFDLDLLADNYRRLAAALPMAEIYYAVKANPAAPVLQTLATLGSNFDAASLAEIDRCLAAGADASRIAFGNTIKKQSDIAAAFALGIRVFTFDCAEELEKLAIAAPGASVICRIFVDNDGARWPLGAKFGCAAGAASDLLVKAQGSGLAPLGVAFHVGSQQTDLASWDMAIGQAAMIFTELRERGIELATLNIGGGVPVAYAQEVPEEAAAITAIQQSLARHFGNRMPAIMAEPGRCLAATAGMVRSEVVLATQRDGQDVRWVYLDIGKFGGLAETIDEAIQYPIVTERDGGNPVPTVLAGPTCDGADVLYQIAGYQLPAELGAGDWVEFRHAGAYTASYSSVGFNGFGPLKEYYL
ncbi:MAG: type III PLP-dependent enzyme [Rhodospirillaceae bacterium]|jgi:ornithine decarboxylase|nr:type III PLP-dependent enzyme [Rhodospirillaceae bacterium]MBT4670584.1 type III PLP-dependent enzyme [Rhodospirillaceae bacterium]MBT4718104.1 type III PLP-dependent enzyme [Rhodospirillaceae bacterium]MBT4751781.1 type III PLP-dependent enzyme [Rhodospirillaceae bacterium]MBT6857176.1 type III PLP-dependent enzyme [Rhodospirillaceae bacterium]